VRQILSIAARLATPWAMTPIRSWKQRYSWLRFDSAAKVINITDPLSTADVMMQFEELLRNAGDPDGTHQQFMACATIV
jgi:hypothetical protein